MSLQNELEENLLLIRESLLNGALKERRFEGTRGPLIALHGAGLSGWRQPGMPSFMKENDVRGVLLHLGLLRSGVDSYVPPLQKEIEKYNLPTLVTFSSGLMIALRYIQRFGTDKIKNIVAIAPPLAGNRKIFGFVGKIVSETTPDSPLYFELMSLRLPENFLTCVLAKKDRITPKPKVFNTGWRIVTTGAENHFDVQNHQKWYSSELKQAIGIS